MILIVRKNKKASSGTDLSESRNDDCSVYLSALGSGTSLLTLICDHKFHIQCLATSVRYIELLLILH
jgi:hypothetical protein